MILDSRHDWLTAKAIVRRIHGDTVKDNADRYFVQNIACKPDFPRASKIGKTKVWNWAEISDYISRQRDKQGCGRPRSQ